MARLTRQNQKVFASNSGSTGIAKMGTMKTGTPVYSTDLATIQSQSYLNGWDDAILNDKAPYLEEMNGVQYGLSYQNAYLLQEGMPEYSATQTYYKGSLAKVIDGTDVRLYQSISDNNTGNDVTNSTYWKIFTLKERSLGQFVSSLVPLTDAELHLLDGTLLSGSGVYGEFVSYIADLYNSGTANNCFVTEGEWQNIISQYGVCGKFVYDAQANTVRLPKVTGLIEGTDDVATIGNVTEGSLPAHTHTVVGNTGVEGSIHTHSRGTMNITGSFGSIHSNYATGAFYISSTGQQSYDGVNYFGANLNFNAASSWTGETSEQSTNHTHSLSLNSGAASNSIYSGNKVQPQTIKVFYYIVVATATKTDIEIDIDDVTTDLNGKAGTDLANLTSAGKILSSGLAMPSTSYITLSVGVSGASYTAPKNGYLCLVGTGQILGGSTQIVSDDFCLMKQGQTKVVTYSGTAPQLYFVYAEGDK